MAWRRNPLRSFARSAVLAIAFLAPASRAAEPALTGNWIGGFERDGNWVYVQMHFRREGTAIKGTCDIPLEFTHDKPLERISVDPCGLRFEMPWADQTLVFAGTLAGTTISGKMIRGGQESAFHLDKTVKVKTEVYAGTYQLEADHYLHIRSWDEMDPSMLQCVDFKTGQIRTLCPSSETTFFTGPAVLVTYPTETTLQFTIGGGGKASGLVWKPTDAAPLAGKPVNLKYADVSFRNGEVTLSGTLVLPEGKGPHPAVIFVHPAGPRSRQGLLIWAEYFALYGIAGLTYDKRGVGASSGDWLRSSFQDLAGDALAGLQLLKGREDIDAGQIGVWGPSQGGWIGPLVAAQSSEIAFLISQSGSGVSPEEQELYRSEAWLRADSFPEAQIRQAMTLIRSRYECARTERGWEELAAAEKAAQNQRWYPYTGGSAGKDHPFWTFWRLISRHDPVPVLEKVKCPVLAVWGALDTFVPVDTSVAVWRSSLAKADNQDVTLRVFPEGDHSLLQARTGGLQEVSRLKGFVPAYFETQRDWLLQRVRVPHESSPSR